MRIVAAFHKVIPQLRELTSEFIREYDHKFPLPLLPARKKNSSEYAVGELEKFQLAGRKHSADYTAAMNKFSGEKIAEFVKEFPEIVQDKIAPHLLDYNDYYHCEEMEIY